MKHFERNEEASHNEIRKHILGRENMKYKGPEAGINLARGDELRLGWPGRGRLEKWPC